MKKTVYLRLTRRGPNTQRVAPHSETIDRLAGGIRDILNEVAQEQFSGQIEITGYRIKGISPQGAQVEYYYEKTTTVQSVSISDIIVLFEWISENWQTALAIIAALASFLLLLDQLGLSLTVDVDGHRYTFSPDDSDNGSGGYDTPPSEAGSSSGLGMAFMIGLALYLLFGT